MTDPVVETTAGRVRGRHVSRGVLRFAGVPYADPTGGENRFRPARPRTPWLGIQDASDFAAVAPQHVPLADAWQRGDAMSEDCLTVNVWTSSLEGRRPVIVWFHGGGFAAGAAHDAHSDGIALARTGDVVIVSVTHRLGLLGFLNLEGVSSDEFVGSANVGVLDLVAALTWIRDNISSFGGDPDAVTIHGHSGGGGKVAALCAIPSARGLFRRAAIHGGPPFGFKHNATAHDTAQRALTLLGIPTAQPERLRDVSVEQLLAAQWDLGVRGHPGPDGMRFAPTFATSAMPEDPYTSFAAGAGSDIDLMIGTALDESRVAAFAQPAYLSGAEISDDDLIRRLQPGFDDPADAERIVTAYRTFAPDLGNVDLFFAVTSDQFRVRSLRLADAKHRGDGRPSWVYVCAANQDKPHRAFHGIEMPLFFNNTTGSTPARTVATALSAELVGFAYGELAASATWGEYTPSCPDQLVIDDRSLATVRAPWSERVGLWDDTPVTARTDPWTTLWRAPE
ncbi:carboxylesterase/lipase family protein [Paramicrobacterium fandaimingii]|uniref:carboxylesterase/lipase family protein n=1 Tax=Paramicrobacterium fandaimingii TaxID=2708079 RepID=UPI0014212E7C|nr:carboxylesterase family protein [Microbacterium fandaimingii]